MARNTALQNLDFSKWPVINVGNNMHQFKNSTYFDIQNAKSKCFYEQIVTGTMKPAVSIGKWYVNCGGNTET